jgi:hypothetical protein
MFVMSSKSQTNHPEPTAIIEPSEVNNTFIPGEASDLVTAVLNSLRTTDGSNPSEQEATDSRKNLGELEPEPLGYAKTSDAECFGDTLSYEEEAFLESFHD